jgi:hypothetical protein
VEDKLDKAYQEEYKKARAKAASWRDDFLVGLAKSQSESKGTDQDKELQQPQTSHHQATTDSSKEHQENARQAKTQCHHSSMH